MKERITSAIKVILMLGVCMIGITLMYIHEGKANTPTSITSTNDTVALKPSFYDKPAKDGLWEALKFYDIKCADIVYAQAILETGHFKSMGCLKHNNLFGLYNSKANRYCRFNHWTESVIAYKFLQRIRYATDPQYIPKLKQIVKKENDKRRYKEGDTIPQGV